MPGWMGSGTYTRDAASVFDVYIRVGYYLNKIQ